MTLFSPFGIATRGNNSSSYFAIGPQPTITPFLRFDNVSFDIDLFRMVSTPIGGIISSLGNTFNAFKASKLVIEARIDRNDPSRFPNYTQMLDYIANQVLPIPIFDSSQSCKFNVTFFTGSETAKDFVVSFLQLPAIVRTSNIMIKSAFLEFGPQLQQHPIFPRLGIPTEVITKWLHHSNSEGIGKERVLCIHLVPFYIENPREIFNHLKEVIFLQFTFVSFFYLIKF